MMCVCPHCGITNRQRKNTTNPVVYQIRSAKRKHFWAIPPCRAERYINRDPQKTSMPGTAAYQKCDVSTAVRQDKTYCVAAIYQQRSGHQSDNTAGRHGGDCRSCIVTAISNTKAYMTQLLSPTPQTKRNQQRKIACMELYIKRDQQNKTMSCAPGMKSNRKTEAKSLSDDTAVSIRVVYQPRSAKQEHIWRSCTSLARYSCISTAIKT